MPAKTRYLAITNTNDKGSFTVGANRSERVEATQVTTSATAGTNVRLSVVRSGTTTQLVHDMYIPIEKIVEPLFRGITFEAGDVFTLEFAAGATASATWMTITTDEQTV